MQSETSIWLRVSATAGSILGMGLVSGIARQNLSSLAMGPPLESRAAVACRDIHGTDLLASQYRQCWTVPKFCTQQA
jgi:hypothetical protein